MRLLLTFFALTTIYSSLEAQTWNQYPYLPSGSLVDFPADEGHHPGEPIEWWYTTGHLIGQNTGTKYSYMLTYFYYPTISDGFRILNIANENTGEFYDETTPMNYPTLSQTHLEIEASPFLMGSNEYFKTKEDSTGTLIPFEYEIFSESAHGSIELDYETFKRPLIVGDSGYFPQGASNYTYYYSQSGIEVTGTLSLGSTTEPVLGTGWIDRQWGNFNPNTGEKYEWFSLNLSNGQDINMWNIFTDQNTIPDTATYRILSTYINDSTQATVSDFDLTRLGYVYTQDSANCYAQIWHLVCDSLNLDLELTLLYNTGEVQLPFKFIEGTTSIIGTANGDTVTGQGFAELLHTYQNPEITITNPSTSVPYQDSLLITWDWTNPDQGLNIRYDVRYSTDNQTTYNSIISGIRDTFYKWSLPAIDTASSTFIQVLAYSVDSTLFGNDIIEVDWKAAGTQDIQTTKINVYPNPVVDRLNILHPQIGTGMIRIYDPSGQLILQQRAQNESTQIQTISWAEGSYILELDYKNNRSTRSFIIKRK